MKSLQDNLLFFSTALEGFDQLFSDCIKTQIEYCRRFQYRYVLVQQSPRHLSRDEAAWLKVPLIRAALVAGYDWVAFLDADCEVRSHTPGFPDYLTNFSEHKSIYMAPGFSGRINSGVIFAKNAPSSLDFFDTLISNADFEVPNPEDRVGWGENGHFIHYGKSSPVVQLLDHNLWNNNSHLDDQSYIQHYVRGPMREWYLANHVAQKKHNVSFSYFRNLVIDVLQHKYRRNASTPESTLLISESMNQLLPYYMKKYPAFTNS